VQIYYFSYRIFRAGTVEGRRTPAKTDNIAINSQQFFSFFTSGKALSGS